MTLSALPEDPVVSCFDDDIMDEVALFMDVAMVSPSDPSATTSGTDNNGVLKTTSSPDPPLVSDMPMPTPITSSASVVSFTSDISSSPITLSSYNYSSPTDLSQQTEFSVPNPFAAIATTTPTNEEQQPAAVTPTKVTSTAPTLTPVSSAPLIPTSSELPDISAATNHPITIAKSPAPIVSTTTTTTTTTAAKPTHKRTVTNNATLTVEIPMAKKRRLSAVSTSSGSDDEATATDEMPIDKRQRNREHAKKSRQRKKNLTLTLQTSVQEMKEENESLKAMIRSKWGEESMDCMKEENQLSPAEKFINALQMPGSKFMSKSTLTFLKSYSDTVKTSMNHRQNAMRHRHHM